MRGYLTVWNGILAFAYLGPAILVFVRRREPDAYPAPWRVLVLNLLLGWTIIGWFAALRLAVQGLPLQPNNIFSRPATDDMPYTSASSGPPVWGGPNSEPVRMRKCPNCTNGHETCPICHGQPTRWVQPQLANASAVLVRCDYCNGNGLIQCRTCSGTGELPY